MPLSNGSHELTRRCSSQIAEGVAIALGRKSVHGAASSCSRRSSLGLVDSADVPDELPSPTLVIGGLQHRGVDAGDLSLGDRHVGKHKRRVILDWAISPGEAIQRYEL